MLGVGQRRLRPAINAATRIAEFLVVVPQTAAVVSDDIAFASQVYDAVVMLIPRAGRSHLGAVVHVSYVEEHVHVVKVSVDNR